MLKARKQALMRKQKRHQIKRKIESEIYLCEFFNCMVKPQIQVKHLDHTKLKI